MLKSRTFIATPPGATIKEQLIARCLRQKEFACRMDLSEKHISKLINGEVQLTPDVAVRLEMVLGVPARFWNNLEAIYREKIAKANAENAMDADKEIARKMPYDEMVKNGWVTKAKNPEDKVVNLRKFFEVAFLVSIEDMSLSKIACRKLAETEKSNYALLAWAQEAKIEARSIETSLIDLKTLDKKLPVIRDMNVMSPEEFCPKLKKLLADCGIALVFLPHIAGTFLHGATFCDGKKIVVGLTVRGKDSDKFWFSLFHELGHILLGHINQPNGTTDADESEANRFAEEELISAEIFDDFVVKNDFSENAILSFAKDNTLLPGIVVGRLQKERFIKYDYCNYLKSKYALTS